MTIALNILLAIIVLAGTIGLLAYNIFASRTPAQPKVTPQNSRSRTITAPRRSYGFPKSVNA